MSVTILREWDGIEKNLGMLATIRLGVALVSACSHGVGHYELFLGHRRPP